MARIDRRSPTGLFVRHRGADGSTDQSTQTSVLCDETPAHQSRSQA